MNLEVSPEQVCEVLNDVRLLIHDCLIPRIHKLEDEIKLLRSVTWPVCQSLTENSQLSDLHNKFLFLDTLDEQEIRKLLILKDEIARKPLQHSTFNLLMEEVTRINEKFSSR